MKKILFTLGIIAIVANTLIAQAPKSFKYQAIARDIEGNVISDQQISLKINLLQGSENGQEVYSEIHNIQTNKFGLINLEIGSGNNSSGAISSINWGLSKYFVNIEIDINGGSDYKSIGVSQLLSVPYALYAETSGSNNIPEEAFSWTDAGSVTYLTGPGFNAGIGTTAPLAKLHVNGTAVNLIQERNINSDASAACRFYKSRGTTSTKTAVQVGDNIGQYQFWGYTPSGIYRNGATLRSRVESFSSTEVSANFIFSTRNSSFTMAERMRISADGEVGIGTANPSTNVHIYESNSSTVPAVLIQQGGTGDASMHYMLGNSMENFTTGIDHNDNHNFKISNDTALKGTTYPEASTMMRIHAENPRPGIVDFNHQSRARVFLSDTTGTTGLPPYTPFTIPFDMKTYDEHNEFSLTSYRFTATEEGYYQVNARCEFIRRDPSPIGGSWCQIGIIKNGTNYYSWGNNMMITNYIPGSPPFQEGANNNAPNVQDVVYLAAGEFIEIYAYHTDMGILYLRAESYMCFCSVHKLS